MAGVHGSETMLAPPEVQRMLALNALGWGAKVFSRARDEVERILIGPNYCS